MKSSFGHEQLFRAMYALAGEGPRKERLVNAMTAGLIHIDPEEDLPEELHDEFKRFLSEINYTAAKTNEGTIQATVATYNDAQVDSAIEKIIGFYDAVSRS